MKTKEPSKKVQVLIQSIAGQHIPATIPTRKSPNPDMSPARRGGGGGGKSQSSSVCRSGGLAAFKFYQFKEKGRGKGC